MYPRELPIDAQNLDIQVKTNIECLLDFARHSVYTP